jgi:hypothetical protein
LKSSLFAGANALSRFQSLILTRPLILNEGYCTVPLPENNLEYDPAYPTKPSPITPMVLQNKLIRLVANVWTAPSGLSSFEAAEATGKVQKWFAELPPVFRTIPDTSLDAKFPYLKFQRFQLHCIGYSAVLGILKPYLTRSNIAKDPTTVGLDYSLLTTAVDYALLQMDVSQQLFDLYYPFYTKNFVVAFTPFDTATLLCSAILRDPQHDLPRRHEVLVAIGKGLSLIKQLKPYSRVGGISYSVLIHLIPSLALSYQEKILVDPEHDVFPDVVERPIKRMATRDFTPSIVSSGGGTISTPTYSSPENGELLSDPALPIVVGDQLQEDEWQFDPNVLLGTQPFSEMDLGVLDSVWKWENIDMSDVYCNQGMDTQDPGPSAF